MSWTMLAARCSSSKFEPITSRSSATPRALPNASSVLPINVASGAFHEVGYTAEYRETKVHPTSQVAFAGKVIPAFKACVDTVTELHKKTPYTRCIGWDLTVDQEEHVQLMEWNAWSAGIGFHEATQGPCFADLGWERLRNDRAR